MLLRLLPAALAVTLVLGSHAGAGQLRQNPTAVLELFTSQGCSSCPAADALLAELGEKRDIIALAYHVDYWDYVGWPDSFAAKAYSDHQRAYAESWGSSRMFTPQMVVNGTEAVVGSRRQEVGIAVQNAALEVPVELSNSGDALRVRIPPRPGVGDAVVWLVTFIDRADVKIERGENQGRTVAYTQIVTGRQLLGIWEPDTGATLKLPLSEVLDGPANGAAILLQQERNGLPGRIVGAAAFQR